MTTSVRFCLSFDPLKWDFIALKINIISKGKRSVDSCVVNDVTRTRQSVGLNSIYSKNYMLYTEYKNYVMHRVHG